MARRGAYLWLVSLGWLRRLDVVAVLCQRGVAHCGVCPLLALFRKRKGGFLGCFEHLAVCHKRAFDTTADDRLSSADFGIAAGAPGPDSQCALVFLASAAFCHLGELPRILFSWACGCRNICPLLLHQLACRAGRTVALGFAQPSHAGVGLDTLNSGGAPQSSGCE